MMDLATFNTMLERLDAAGFAAGDIEWSENVGPPASPEQFAEEAIFVICNSGMKNTVARKIYDRIMPLVRAGKSSREGFGHAGKCGAIDYIWQCRATLLEAYLEASDKVEWCATLPWIGGITKYHLAKNFGADVCKPDVHLQRLADVLETTPQRLCDELAMKTGYRSATIDLLVWRACANGILNSHTGELAVSK